MTNPLKAVLGGGMPNMPAPLNNMQVMMQSFNKFASAFKGDPKQKVQELLNSGAMSQQQLNQLMSMAKQFQSFLK